MKSLGDTIGGSAEALLGLAPPAIAQTQNTPRAATTPDAPTDDNPQPPNATPNAPIPPGTEAQGGIRGVPPSPESDGGNPVPGPAGRTPDQSQPNSPAVH